MPANDNRAVSRHPLCWPVGWPRTHVADQVPPRFSKGERVYSSSPGGSYVRHRDLSVSDGVRRVVHELQRLGVQEADMVISTNMPLRLDGLPRSDAKAPADPGVAVYWQRPGESMRCMAVDRYTTVAGNLGAIAATLEAMRAIERHGGAQILDRAFTGFAALPPPAGKTWRAVLGVPPDVLDLGRVRDLYRKLASANHPDRGGDVCRMAEINAAWLAAQKELQP